MVRKNHTESSITSHLHILNRTTILAVASTLSCVSVQLNASRAGSFDEAAYKSWKIVLPPIASQDIQCFLITELMCSSLSLHTHKSNSDVIHKEMEKQTL